MSAKRFTEEFKVEAVGLVVDTGYRVIDVAVSLYRWIKERRAPGSRNRAFLPLATLA